MYKAFLRTHLDCGDIIFDQAFNDSVHLKIEVVQYDIALAKTGKFRGTSKEISYKKLGFDCLKFRR